MHLISQLIAKNLLELQVGLIDLLNNKLIRSLINEDVIFDLELRHDSVGFWSILLMAGYLKATERERDHFGDDIYGLLFVNEEMGQSIRKTLLRTIIGAHRII